MAVEKKYFEAKESVSPDLFSLSSVSEASFPAAKRTIVCVSNIYKRNPTKSSVQPYHHLLYTVCAFRSDIKRLQTPQPRMTAMARTRSSTIWLQTSLRRLFRWEAFLNGFLTVFLWHLSEVIFLFLYQQMIHAAKLKYVT